MNYYSEHSKVWVSVDCIIFGFEDSKLKLLIGRRQMDPGRGEWSLYGGFVRVDESLEDAANRVLYELTGMKKTYMKQVGAFGAIDRDPGERVISIAYCALINVSDYDDMLREQHHLEWVNIDEMPKLYSDHKEMGHAPGSGTVFRPSLHGQQLSLTGTDGCLWNAFGAGR